MAKFNMNDYVNYVESKKLQARLQKGLAYKNQEEASEANTNLLEWQEKQRLEEECERHFQKGLEYERFLFDEGICESDFTWQEWSLYQVYLNDTAAFTTLSWLEWRNAQRCEHDFLYNWLQYLEDERDIEYALEQLVTREELESEENEDYADLLAEENVDHEALRINKKAISRNRHLNSLKAQKRAKANAEFKAKKKAKAKAELKDKKRAKAELNAKYAWLQYLEDEQDIEYVVEQFVTREELEAEESKDYADLLAEENVDHEALRINKKAISRNRHLNSLKAQKRAKANAEFKAKKRAKAKAELNAKKRAKAELKDKKRAKVA